MIKRILISISALLIMYLIVCSFVIGATKGVGEQYQVQCVITDNSGNHVSGQTPKLKIKKVSNGRLYDFSDSSFKSSLWVSSTTTMSENTVEQFYYYTFFPPSSENVPDQYLFIVDNYDTNYRIHGLDSVDYINTSVSSSTIANIDRNTNGIKDGGVWNGVERLIKQGDK